jgi:NAD(P)-dependent dehydrogenase (short-subunit alcohol dehydrogenase family)
MILISNFSISGAGMGAYSASKFGMEAVTDTLRQELRKWNVSVSAIEPGFVRTPLVINSLDPIQYEKTWDSLAENVNFPLYS